MNKAKFVETLSAKTTFTKADSEVFLDAALDIIRETVSKGEEVKLVGFGTFDHSVRKERRGRNPKTGTSLLIPETVVPRFRPGKEFKESLVKK